MKLCLYFFLSTVIAVSQTEIQRTEQFLADREFIKAQELMEVFVKDHPDHLQGIELLGDAYGHQKKWDGAIKNYKTLVALSPDTANYHYKYGGALGMKALTIHKIKALAIIGDVKQAFLTAAELNPNHIETRWALVELYMQLPGIIGGSKSKALVYADELQQLSKVDGYLAKGYIHEFDKEYKLAEKYYKLAVAEGKSLVCYDKLIKLYELIEQPGRAIATIEAALERHGQNDLNYQIGRLAVHHEVMLDKGAQHLITYINHYSATDTIEPAWAHYYLAKIYKLQKRKAEAYKSIELALSELPLNDLFKKEKEMILNLP